MSLRLIGLFFFFALPFFTVLPQFFATPALDFSDLWWALKGSFGQSLGSTLASLTLGAWLGLGLCRLPLNGVRPLRFLLLVPCLAPTLFLILGTFSWLQPFPFGYLGVIFLHSLMLAGFVGVWFEEKWRASWTVLTEVGRVCGASPWLFWKSMGRKIAVEFLSIGSTVFLVCWTSFSIPLVASGGRVGTLEILIYEKLRITNDWTTATVLSVVQSMAVLFVGFGAASRLSPAKSAAPSRSAHFQSTYGSRVGVFFVASYLALYFLPWVVWGPSSWEKLSSTPGLWSEVTRVGMESLLISIGSGATVFLFLWGLCFLNFSKKEVTRMSFWLPPGVTLVAAGVLQLPVANLLLLLFLAYLLLFVPSLLRWLWVPQYQLLQSQVEVARVLGAPRALIGFFILSPQMLPAIGWLSGVSAVWALGDFAVSRIVLGQTRTWALLTESLVSSYRVEAGMALGGILMMVSLGFSFYLLE